MISDLKKWTEIEKGLYRYVVAASVCYEIHIMYHSKNTDILKTLKSIDASLKSIAKSVQPVNTTVTIDDNSEDAVRDFLNSLHQKNIQQEEIKDDN